MFSSFRRLIFVKNQRHCTKCFSSKAPFQTANKTSTGLERYFDLPGNNADVERAEFQNRRSTLAHDLASQASLLASEKIASTNAIQTVPDSTKNHLVIIPSAQRKYMVDKIPYWPFRQATDFRYLTGSKSHSSALVLRFDGTLETVTSTLLIPDASPREEVWEGPQIKPDEACDIFGVDNAIYFGDFPLFLHNQIMHCQKNMVLWYDYLNPSHTEIHRIVMRLIEGSQFVNQPVQSPRMAVQRQRLIKTPKEIEAMRKACQISSEAINATMSTSLEHNSETKLFAKLEYESRVRGADFLAYPPVVATGNNANVIHYTRYSKNMSNEDHLVLVDCGCDVGGYASDITRTWPLSGKFNPHQKLIYEVVLDIQQRLLSALSENTGKLTVDQLYRMMQAYLGQSLLSLGLIPQELVHDEFRLNEASGEFCPHHVSHYLGLDVHDTSLISRNIPLQEGMVITVEPGIYIPENPSASRFLSKVPNSFRGIGVRIEDDILITRKGRELSCEILSNGSPRQIGDIEDLVNSQCNEKA